MDNVEIDNYIRVGTSLYKIVQQPLPDGEFVKKYLLWNIETFKQDFSKDDLSKIKKYDGYCIVPNHIRYQTVVDGFLNKYESLDFQPHIGEWNNIRSLIYHIFGEQFEFGLDYFQLLYLQPLQKLPILLIVSKERNTGKTTFLNFLKDIFGSNMTFNTNEEFRSQFNSDWIGKLIVGVDEVLLNRREDSERIKNLSTASVYKVEAKGKDRNEVAMFSKFVLCSNNINNPIIIDKGETRYWVRNINPLTSDDTSLGGKLRKEIPQFLYFLKNRKLATTKSSRMWFSPSQIETQALLHIIRCNRNHLELEMLEITKTIMETFDITVFNFCVNDL